MTTLVLNRRRSSRWSLLAVLAAAAVALSVYSYLSWLRSQVPISGPLVPLVVAARDIDSGTAIDASMLKIVDHPSMYLPAGSFRSEELLTGKVAAVPVLEGEPFTERKIGKTGGASSVVPAGMRAYSLNAQAVAGLAIVPRSGDRVDILVTYAGENGEAITETILGSAKVASIQSDSGSKSSEVAGSLGVSSAEKKEGVTVLVTPGQAEDLAKAESLGKIAIVLAPNVLEEQIEDGAPQGEWSMR